MNNTDNTNFWDYPLYYQIFVIFILISTAMTDLRDFFILILIQKLLGNIAFFNGTKFFLIPFAIMLIGLILATILNVVFTRFL